MFDWLFGTSPKRRKKANKAKKKTSKKKSPSLKRFVIFDKDTEKVLATVSGKTETQAWKSWSAGKDTDGVRIMTKARWDKENK